MINVEQTIIKILEIELDDMSSEIRKQIELQGHSNTGRLSQSVSVRIEKKSNVISGIIEFNYYGQYVNQGVPALKIPFTKGSGRKSSKYIDALIDYFRTKGLSEKESKQASFATAMKHKKEGMPTQASKRFSQTGKRTGAVVIAIDKINPQIEKGLSEQIDNYVVARVNIPFAELQKAS